MPRPRKLNDDEVRDRLAAAPDWAVLGGKLRREFEFRDFVQAFGFMAQMALVSEAKNHHPEWSNVYKRVEVELITHDAGGITELDFEWAIAADDAAKSSVGQ
jgi:4a-hydroxytetrahydrobiopterin dehydratase